MGGIYHLEKLAERREQLLPITGYRAALRNDGLTRAQTSEVCIERKRRWEEGSENGKISRQRRP